MARVLGGSQSQCKTPFSHNSGSIKHRAVRFVCRLGFSGMARKLDSDISPTTPLFLQGDKQCAILALILEQSLLTRSGFEIKQNIGNLKTHLKRK